LVLKVILYLQDKFLLPAAWQFHAILVITLNNLIIILIFLILGLTN
jgi:hypothetical protein